MSVLDRLGFAAALLAAGVFFCACPGDKQPPPPPPPPQVFLTNPNGTAHVISTTLKMNVAVSGCQSVKQVQILQAGNFIQAVDAPKKFPVTVEMLPSAFNSYYNKVGIAAHLNLSAKAVCDDDRSNTSTGLALDWFPVASVLKPSGGAITTMPDAFVAEGGVSSATTFVGCIGTGSGLAIARVDTTGMVIGANTTLPFNCSAVSTITDKNAAAGVRWLMEPGVGAFAFDQAMNINGYLLASLVQIGVGPEGDALVYSNQSLGGNSLFRVAANGGSGNAVWGTTSGGLLLTSPVINVGTGEAYVLAWVYDLGSNSATIEVERFGWNNGAFVGSNVLGSQSYGNLNTPVLPGAAFNKNGSLVYFAVLSISPGGAISSQVVACSSLSPGCSPPNAVQWASPSLDTAITAVVPYANDKIIAAIAADRVYFIDGTTGALLSYMAEPLIATGGLNVLMVQPGGQRDFYVLNGPAGGFPTEVIAVDDPANGELWRFNVEGGGSPQQGVTMAVDEGGQPWLRVGTDQVKPLGLTDYRNVRGNSP